MSLAQQSSDPQKPPETAPEKRASASPTPTFKSRSDLVLVPVVVRDKSGKHVEGLSKEDFRLWENGKEQAISFFEEIGSPDTQAHTSPGVDRGYSNVPFDNADQQRLTIILLDLLNTTPLQRTDARDQMLKFLAKGLAPNQPVSLLCITSKGLRLVHPFSQDASVLIQALKQTDLGSETIIPRRDVVVRTVQQLREIAQAYAGIPGRKSMIFAAGYIPELASEDQVFLSSIYADDLRRMFKDLIDANISVYPIQLLGATVDPTIGGLAARPTDLMLRGFADSTGGNRCIETNDLLGCLAEAVEDSRSYYMLGFSVQPNDRKPGWRDLKVKVSAQHVNVRARSGFYYGEPRPQDAKSAQNEEINALASPLAYSAVPMFVKVLPLAAKSESAAATTGKKTTVEFLVTIPLSSIRIDPAQTNALDLTVGAISLTRDTREAAEFRHPLRGNPKPENLQEWARDGIVFREKLELPPGSYDVRFLAHDNNAGQIGTVVFPLEVR